jgi:hypothetical protein
VDDRTGNRFLIARTTRLVHVAAAAAVLALFRFGLRVATFQRLLRLARGGTRRAEPDPARTLQTAELVSRATRVLPGKSSCLAQALATSFLLARHQIHSSLVIGVARVEFGHRFHAWLEADGVIVIGEGDAAGCVRLGVFE